MKSKDILAQEDHDDRLSGFLELKASLYDDDDDVETSPQPPPLPPLDDSVGPVGLGGPHPHQHHHNPCIDNDEDDEDENILTGIQVNPETLEVPAGAGLSPAGPTTDLLEQALLAVVGVPAPDEAALVQQVEETNHVDQEQPCLLVPVTQFEFPDYGGGVGGATKKNSGNTMMWRPVGGGPARDSDTSLPSTPSSASSLMLSSTSTPSEPGSPPPFKHRSIDNLGQHKVVTPLFSITELRDREPETQESINAHKKIIFNHPMFPLLALLLEKCEAVTNNLETAEEVEASLHTEVKIFLEQLILDSPLMTDNPEADEVMLLGLQVLRIHISELSKVKELCRDFSKRYITSLSLKMQSENLIKKAIPGAEKSVRDEDSDEGVSLDN